MRKTMLFVLLAVGLLAAKSYNYSKIRTEVRLRTNGEARIWQTRTYRFDGDFSWAFVDLDKAGATDIEFDRIAESTRAGARRRAFSTTDRDDADMASAATHGGSTGMPPAVNRPMAQGTASRLYPLAKTRF